MPVENMTDQEFFERAIRRCRKEGFKGIHTVYSGVNNAYRQFRGKDADPIAAVNKLIAAGHLAGNPAKGGFTIYLPEDAKSKTIQVTLDKILKD